MDIPAEWIEQGRYCHDAELGMMKQCIRCLHYLPADREFFHKTCTSRDGLHAWCKACAAHRDLPSPAFNPLRAAEFNRWCVYRVSSSGRST